jgi:hypothetical protein
MPAKFATKRASDSRSINQCCQATCKRRLTSKCPQTAAIQILEDQSVTDRPKTYLLTVSVLPDLTLPKAPDDSRSRVKGVVGANVAEALTSVVDQESVALGCHEIRVAVDVARSVELGQNLVHECIDLVVRATSAELGDPDRATGRNLASVIDIVLEVGRVGRIIIPVQS